MSIAPLAPDVLVIGHRGASALRPEHTLASYAQAIADGADFIEPDLVMTRDGVLVARHENEIGGTTDVAARATFAARQTRKTIDGVVHSGWFTEDFTLAELKTLRARERLPALRPANTAFDGRFEIPTFDEILNLAAAESARRGRQIGVYPEIKHSTYFAALGLAMEDRVLATLRAHPFIAAGAPVFIQSFETANLRALRAGLAGLPAVRLIQLLGEPQEQPWDVAAAGGSLTASQMQSPQGLRDIAAYADAIGPNKLAVISRDADGTLGTPSALVADAHAAGLLVHPYTFRPEPAFLPAARYIGTPPLRDEAGAIAEIRAYLDAGIDGFFTDDPALGRRALAHR